MTTMAEVFAASGYATALFGKWHLGDNYPHRPVDRGFGRQLYHLGWGITSTPDYWANDYFDDFFYLSDRVQQFPGYCTDVWFEEAGRWIRDCHRQGKPFFAYVSTNAPHGPFFAPEEYKAPYAELDKDTRGFFAMIANLDENVAKLDSLLGELGLREDTIFIFMTDNGGTGGINVFNAGMRGAKASYYDGGHRVPFFLRWPAGGLRPAGELGDLTHSTDVLPTLIELCGLDKPRGKPFDGVSLSPLLHGRSQPGLNERMIVVQYGRLDPATPQPWDAAVLWRHWRLVAGNELYDMAHDPGQQTDVSADRPAVVARMREHYQQWWNDVQPTLDEFEYITLGTDHENPCRLSSLDWLANKLVPAAQPFDIRGLGVPVVEGSLPGGRPMPQMNGFWNVEIERAGRYRICLRRWPKEADTAITAPLPEYHGVDGVFPAGKALPAAQARLKVADQDVTKDVPKQDKAIEFVVDLPAGKTHLQTWFLDANGTELCGAFYVEVFRLP
jgi:arylsulfatase A-like enzyme